MASLIKNDAKARITRKVDFIEKVLMRKLNFIEKGGEGKDSHCRALEGCEKRTAMRMKK
jgi:hypothetical protein